MQLEIFSGYTSWRRSGAHHGETYVADTTQRCPANYDIYRRTDALLALLRRRQIPTAVHRAYTWRLVCLSVLPFSHRPSGSAIILPLVAESKFRITEVH